LIEILLNFCGIKIGTESKNTIDMHKNY